VDAAEQPQNPASFAILSEGRARSGKAVESISAAAADVVEWRDT
jgi:hypothetical protein